MESLLIQGPVRLCGEVTIDGSKNAALPLMAAGILTNDNFVLSNVPHLKDVTSMLELLGYLGMDVSINEKFEISMNANDDLLCEVPYDLMKTMRASILLMGPLLGRFGRASISLPGGCAIGSRPVDMHIDAMKKLGAKVDVLDGNLNLSAPDGLKGAVIEFEKVTVTGTENVLMAAVVADGQTVLKNVAIEPEVLDLIACLRSMGADIDLQRDRTLVINGVKSLKGVSHHIIPDRIEAATFLIGACMSQGDVTVKKVDPSHLEAVLLKLEEAGAVIEKNQQSIRLIMNQPPRAVGISTGVYPDFPTDVQAQWVALCAVARGEAVIQENVFENRFMHVEELRRLGADLKVDGICVTTNGKTILTSAPMEATDLRASAGLVLAAMSAEGESRISNIFHIDRGYAYIEEKLSQLGACIIRVNDKS